MTAVVAHEQLLAHFARGFSAYHNSASCTATCSISAAEVLHIVFDICHWAGRCTSHIPLCAFASANSVLRQLSLLGMLQLAETRVASKKQLCRLYSCTSYIF